ncbi:MAG: hypothetical protein HYU78_04135 [Rhodocyclales bacterium]|nr:hypothetical protein [Rhodocyclales bacterium]
MKIANIPHLIRLAVLRTLLRAAGFVFRRFVMPGLRPAAARARGAHAAHRSHDDGLVIDGEYRRLDPRHNDRW